jgi:hypothetical protein
VLPDTVRVLFPSSPAKFRRSGPDRDRAERVFVRSIHAILARPRQAGLQRTAVRSFFSLSIAYKLPHRAHNGISRSADEKPTTRELCDTECRAHREPRIPSHRHKLSATSKRCLTVPRECGTANCNQQQHPLTYDGYDGPPK